MAQRGQKIPSLSASSPSKEPKNPWAADSEEYVAVAWALPTLWLKSSPKGISVSVRAKEQFKATGGCFDHLLVQPWAAEPS